MATLKSPGVSLYLSTEHDYTPLKDTSPDGQYLDLVRYAMAHGDRKPNRTGIDTISVFGYQMRFDLRDGTIPLLTTKKMFTRGIIHEILWYLSGSDNIKYLTDNNVHIWDEWAKEDGSLGPVYGVQWRKWPGPIKTISKRENFDNHMSSIPGYKVIGPDSPTENWDGEVYVQSYIDQIAILVDKLKNNPNDRRMIVSAWNVADLPTMGLPPCHYSFQCYAKPLTVDQRMDIALRTHHKSEVLESTEINTVEGWLDQIRVPKHELSMILNQRSCDIALGVPFNIVQYSILLRMLAEVANMTPGEFVWNGGDVHIYENHISGLNTQLQRTPLPSPTFRFARDITDIDDFKFEDFVIEGYTSHSTIKFDVAV
jgi:thymidylate synthase